MILLKKNKYSFFFYFHKINTKEGDYNLFLKGNTIDSDHFEHFLKNILKRKAPLSLMELTQIVQKNEKPPQKRFLITFDDGYRDNLYNALPILEKYQVPAVVFVTIGFINQSVIPYEYVLAEIVRKEGSIDLEWEGNHFEFNLSHADEKQRAYHRIRQLVKFSGHEIRMVLLKKLNYEKYIDETTIFNQFLTWEEVRELHHHPLIEIGSHGYSHVPLNSTEVNHENEINGSKQELEKQIGSKIQTFSYPYGAVNETVLNFIKNKSSYRLAFATGNKPMKHPVDPLNIPRTEKISEI